jgi:carboxyl-terminal processing protease
MKRYALIVMALLSAAPLGTLALDMAPDAHQGRVARMLALNMPLRHLSRESLDDHISTNALEIFLGALDGERTYFLASDIADFQTVRQDLDDQLKAGDVAIAYKIYNVFKTRVANRVAYVKELLDQGFDLSQDETYAWKRKDAEWPKDEETWNDLWRRKIKHELVARMVAQKIGQEEGSVDEGKSDPATNSASAAEAKLPPEQQIRKSYDRFLTIMQDNDAGWLLERYLNGFTRAYDPHTDYMSPASQEDFSIGMSLSLQGIGALLGNDEGAARVERLIPGGPAERDGRLRPGDKIIAVAQGDEEPVDVLHWPLSKTVRLIRGEKGSKVVLTVIPVAAASTQTRIEIIRDEVKLEEQAAKSEVRTVPGPDGIERRLGIISLPEFYADMSGGKKGEEPRSSARDVADLLAKLRDDKVEGMVLDLRSNGGGSLNDAVTMTGLFIESGPVVQIKSQRQMHTLSDPNPDVTYTGPVVVLVNRLSASASEILAAALQDYGRAIIIGDERTHGKGTVQTLVNLSNAATNMGSLKVTTASFYRIAGGSTQMKGVESDIVLPSPLDSMEVGEEQLPHAMPWTQVEPAFFDRTGTRDEVLPLLRQRSEERRSQDVRYSAYTNLLARLAERQQSTAITLNYEERLKLAHSEKDLQKQLEENDPDKTQDADKKKSNDLVMLESLNILSDWVSLIENKPATAER